MVATQGQSTASALWALIAFAYLAPALVSAALFPAKTPVVQLTNANFKREVLDIEKPTFVAFTAPWCGHCQRLAPEYHKAAASLDGIVKFANIDCDEDKNKGICAQYQVQGFPTIKLFPATKKRLPRDYRGDRSAKALVDHAKDALPMGARKLQPTELQSWMDEAPGRPKVLLFSDKPKSSPLFRSLALDFRSTMNFGFLRGDEQLARSQGRLVLGVDIPTEKDLPVLLIAKGRSKNADGSWPPIEKGAFETYAGALKYRPIKAWLDEVAPRMGSRKSSGGSSTDTKPSKKDKSKPKASAKVMPEKVREAKEEIIPEGGAVEWKAQKPAQPGAGANKVGSHDNYDSFRAPTKAKPEGEREERVQDKDDPVMDESAPGKDTWRGKMLDIERAGEIADKLREEAAQIGKENRKRFPHLYPPEGVAMGTENFLEKARQAGSAFVDAAAKVYNDASEKVGEHIDNAARAVTDAAQDAGDNIGEAAEKLANTGDFQNFKGPFAEKSQALMKQFAKWMSNEAPEGWEETLGDAYARAQVEAESLLRKNPEEALRQARQAEKWLLKEMEQDRSRMDNVMTDEQRSQVDSMIEEVQKRLKSKSGDEHNPFERTTGAAGAQNPFSDIFAQAAQKLQAAGSPEAVDESKPKKSHDEL